MLSPDRHQAIIAHINARWAHKTCQLCGRNEWTADGYITMPIADRLGPILGSSAIPVIVVTCINCGNMVMVNALVADVPPPKFAEPTGVVPQPGPIEPIELNQSSSPNSGDVGHTTGGRNV